MNGRRHSQVILSCSCWTSGMLAVGSLEIIQVRLEGGWSSVQQVFCVKSLPQKHSSLPLLIIRSLQARILSQLGRQPKVNLVKPINSRNACQH